MVACMSALNSCVAEFHAITFFNIADLDCRRHVRAPHAGVTVSRHLDAALPQDYTVGAAASNC
jgi:hypothetical protein